MGDAEEITLQEQVRKLQGENAALLDLLRAVAAARGNTQTLVDNVNVLMTAAVLRTVARLENLGPHQPGEGNQVLHGYMDTLTEFLATPEDPRPQHA